MSAATATTPSFGVERHRRGPIRGAWHDMLAVAQRNLIAIYRVPQILVFTTIQPVIFVLLWRFVFGGAINTLTLPPGISYVDYLMPGIFVQTAVFGSMGAAIGLATDLKSGLLERFRSLPMARSAVLSGRTAADVARNVFVVTLMAIIGFMVGFHVQTDFLGFVAGMLLLLAFGYAMSWVFAAVGLWVGDPESAQAAAFPIMAILVFASSVFVPIAAMPSWMQPWAENQPVSVTANAVRQLMLGVPEGDWIVKSIAWIVVIIAIAAPLAVWRYRKAA